MEAEAATHEVVDLLLPRRGQRAPLELREALGGLGRRQSVDGVLELLDRRQPLALRGRGRAGDGDDG